MANGRRCRLLLRHPLECDIWFYDDKTPQVPAAVITTNQTNNSGLQGTGHGQTYNQGIPSDQQRHCGHVNCPKKIVSGSSAHFQPTDRTAYQQNRVPISPHTSTPTSHHLNGAIRFDSSVESRIRDGNHPATASDPHQSSSLVVHGGDQAVPNIRLAVTSTDAEHSQAPDSSRIDQLPSSIQNENTSPIRTLETLETTNQGSQGSNRTLSSDSNSSSSSGITFKIRTRCHEEEVVERIEDCLHSLIDLLRRRGVPMSTFSTTTSTRPTVNDSTNSSNNHNCIHGGGTTSNCRPCCTGTPGGKGNFLI